MVFFSSSLFGLHNRCFDPSVVIKPLTSPFLSLAMDTSSLGIAVFSDPTSLGAFSSYLIISAFALNRSSTPDGPFDSSNFNFPSFDQILDFVFERVAIFC